MNAKHLVLLLACALGCEEVDAGDGGGNSGGTGGSSPVESDSDPSAESGNSPLLADCRETCDDLLFYDCLTADTHEACYDTCSDRASQDIETFRACVQNTLPTCSECYENFADAEPADPTTSSEMTTAGPDETSGGSSGTCLDACEEYVGAGCNVEFSDVEFTSCEEFCGALSGTAQALVVECVAEREGCTLPEYCTMSSSGGG